jgi:hypothetical protein
MKVIRIALLSGGVSAVLSLSIFGYQIIILNNTEILVRFSEIIKPPLFGIFIFIVFIFMLVSTLISFPYLVYKCIPFFIIDNWLSAQGRERLKRNLNMLSGLLFCSLIMIILITGSRLVFV